MSEKPVLPQSLLDLIGEYGLATADGCSSVERLHRWELLIDGIKDYARAALAAAAGKVDQLEPALWLEAPDGLVRVAFKGGWMNLYEVAKAHGLMCADPLREACWQWLDAQKLATPPQPPQAEPAKVSRRQADEERWAERCAQLDRTRAQAEPRGELTDEAIRNEIREVLGHHQLTHTLQDDDNGGLPLVDMLTPKGDGSIARGSEELDLLADEIAIALAALSAQPVQQAAGVPNGWKLVPKRATGEMLFAWAEAAKKSHCLACQENYDAMLAASPDGQEKA